MLGKELGSNARKLIKAIASIRSMDVVVPVKRGEQVVNVHVSTVAKPEKNVATLLAHLGLRLPKRAIMVENVVEKIT